MEVFNIRELSFFYPGQSQAALDKLTFSVEAGDFIVLIGPSGCGKTTLLRQLKSVLTPHGMRSGELLFEGKPLSDADIRTQASQIGFVGQSPENQTVTDKVWHELAFGLESLGFDTPTIRVRVAETASFFGIQNWFYKSVTELSGGQQQLVNLAAVMVMQPSVLILDEPTAQLDPIAASDFLAAVGKINRELGTTVIMTEHRLEELMPLSTRALAMDRGSLVCDAPAQELGALLKAENSPIFLSMPTPLRVWAAVENSLTCPLSVREGRGWLEAFASGTQLKRLSERKPFVPSSSTPAVELRDVWFRYEKDGPDVVKGLSLKAYSGELLCILGGNGTGKTTALSLMAGLNRPCRGKIKTDGSTLAALPQNPQTLFTQKTVYEELAEMLEDSKLPKAERESRILELTRLCEVEPLLGRHPYDLSGGEQQRAALAKLMLLRPGILLLDEPTKGLDAQFKMSFASILRSLTKSGVCVVMVSHDVEFCAAHADSCAMFFDGNIVAENTPRAFFSGNSFYTTAASRMARQLIPDAVTAEDVIEACGGKPPLRPEPKAQAAESESFAKVEHTPPRNQKADRRLSKRTLLALAMVLIAVPLTIFFGVYCLGDRKYYFISLLVILETLLPFVLVFESRKPQARELVIIAVLCALGVAGRAAFLALPEFKPVLAIVIISGVAFGGETGFLVGTVTMFVSNMLFGQGSWTPWQMFSMGIIGFLAGVLFRRGMLRSDRLSLSVFGAVTAVVIYGGLMNSASVLMYQQKPSWGMLLTAYAAGFPLDLIHAASTALFLWFISQPLIEKLERVKLKYGLDI